MRQIIKANDPRRLLTLAPMLAGGVPTDSALILPFIGKRTWSAVRIDLPSGHEHDADEWAAGLARFVDSLDADGAAVIVYPGFELGLDPLPMQRAVDTLIRAFEDSGILVKAALAVGTDSWGDYARPQSALGPLAELYDVTEVGVDDGDPGVFLAGEDALPAEPDARWCEEQAARIDLVCDDDYLCDPVHAIVRALELGPDKLTDDQLAELTTCVQRPVIRDEMLMTMLGGEEEGLKTRAAAFAWHLTGQSKRVEEEAALVMGIEGTPDRDRVHTALRLWKTVAAHTVPEQQAAVFAVLAWLYWAVGKSSVAQACVERAFAGDPDHGFARIVASILDSGHIPCWIVDAFRGADPGRSHAA